MYIAQVTSRSSPPAGGNGSSPNTLTPVSKTGFEALLWSGVAIAISFTAMRCAIRLKLAGRLMEDDMAVLTATTFFIALAACYQSGLDVMWSFNGNTGSTATEAELEVHERWQKYQLASYLLFWVNLWSVKASFLLFFRKLLIGTITRRMIWWYLVAAFTLGSFVTSVGLLLGSCRPLSAYWTANATSCSSPTGVDMAVLVLWFSSMADVVSDILIMILPWQLLWGLRVNLKQKFALACVFSLSIIIVLFSLLRVTHTTPGTGVFGPISLAFWSILEATVAVVVACLPSLKFLVTSRRNRSGYNRRGYSGSGSGVGAIEADKVKARGQDMRLGHIRNGLGSKASIGRGSKAIPKSDSQESIIPNGIYVYQDVSVTEGGRGVSHNELLHGPQLNTAWKTQDATTMT